MGPRAKRIQMATRRGATVVLARIRQQAAMRFARGYFAPLSMTGYWFVANTPSRYGAYSYAAISATAEPSVPMNALSSYLSVSLSTRTLMAMVPDGPEITPQSCEMPASVPVLPA